MKFKASIDGCNFGKKKTTLKLSIDNKDNKGLSSLVENFTDKPITIELLIDEQKIKEDNLKISDEQRRFIYTLIKVSAKGYGETNETMKSNLKEWFCEKEEIPVFSLSDVKKDIATMFIAYIINLAVERNWLEESYKNKSIDYWNEVCLKYKICYLCGRQGDIHHIDAIGMGRDRKGFDDTNNRKMCLCRKHHNEAHNIGRETFFKKYHIDII